MKNTSQPYQPMASTDWITPARTPAKAAHIPPAVYSARNVKQGDKARREACQAAWIALCTVAGALAFAAALSLAFAGNP